MIMHKNLSITSAHLTLSILSNIKETILKVFWSYEPYYLYST